MARGAVQDLKQAVKRKIPQLDSHHAGERSFPSSCRMAPSKFLQVPQHRSFTGMTREGGGGAEAGRGEGDESKRDAFG